MRKIGLLSASSAVALAVAVSASPASAFDAVDWNWNSALNTNIDANFNIDTDFIGWGLTQVERLQVMAGNMAAYADGSGAHYSGAGGYYDTSGVAPIHIVNEQTQTIAQAAANTADGSGGAGGALIEAGGAVHHLISEQGPGDQIIAVGLIDADFNSSVEQNIDQDAKNIGIQVNYITVDMGEAAPWKDPVNALDHLAKVEIAATAISNVATIESQHVVMAHDGQIAFGDFKQIGGEYDEYNGGTEQAIMANLELANWIDHDGYTFVGSGNRNFDMLLLGWTAAQYGLIEKGYNVAVANGNDITNAAADVSATAAANIHTVSVETLLESGPSGYGYTIASDNIAMVDLNQFGYMDTYAQATATNHTIHGYSHLGKLDAPVLKVTASALGNVSTIGNKFGGSAD